MGKECSIYPLQDILLCYKDVGPFSSLTDCFFFFSVSTKNSCTVWSCVLLPRHILLPLWDLLCGTSIDLCLLAVTHGGWLPKSTTLGWCKGGNWLINWSVWSADGLIQLPIDANKVLIRCWGKSQQHSYVFNKNRHTHLYTQIFASGASVVRLSTGLRRAVNWI